ncbi:NACHT domain-containing protein (plasmid) [Nostoc sp. UHCC 0926]|uniref:NACHT domain-containing protein n=1 Tax=Nostoc sp. UHCC 0926 TaxID=3025190 RepID=UPI00235E9B21|nr:NACHT domain-containing protein [Nostoc sp. UHCC 0926]WDD36289.1 NACHT domain-containing protein [Nostoc sp. UHCC 0926]
MNTPDELITIFDRILQGSYSQEEAGILRQWLRMSEDLLQFVAQDGKFNTNIGQVQGGEIHIGDRNYQGIDAESIRVTLQEVLSPQTHQIEVDWHSLSQQMLEEQRLTTNPLTSLEGIAYRTEQVYVPLGLVERNKRSRRREDVSPEEGSALYEETEITQRFENEEFLKQVLQQGQSPKSQGKRIAIIGEPGAGKTTILQQIARWVSGEMAQSVVIWVSLADLRGQELEPYLLGRWLQAVARRLGQAESSLLLQDTFVAQFQQSQVWLMLDGVDEMQVLGDRNPLTDIERQIRIGGLLSQTRIILTCRLNFWDAARNALDKFDTYRTLEYSYPQQVEQFIGKWFGALPPGEGEQAKQLCVALRESGNERIRDLVKNPLRLTLLCFNWQLGEGTLPETKAGLYEQFVDDFYEWKPEQFPTTAKQRQQLNAALSELAREAIDKQATRYWLRHNFVCEFLGEPDEPDSLFKLALELGWLNKVGIEPENTKKTVYAFFHPTFQEYFAALVIDDWHFFLNHIPDNPSHSDANYRIFEPQWKTVFLLWLGRQDINKFQKETFIKTLVDFDDSCGAFYWHHAVMLAGVGIGEFKNCQIALEIVDMLVTWRFGYYHEQKREWQDFPEYIQSSAWKSLNETDRSFVVEALTELICLRNKQEGKISFRTLEFLVTFDSGNSFAKKIQVKILQNTSDDSCRQEAARILGDISFGDSEVISTLLEILHTSLKDVLAKLPKPSEDWILLPDTEDDNKFEELEDQSEVMTLKELQELKESLAQARAMNLKSGLDWYAVESLHKIDPGNPEIINSLIKQLGWCPSAYNIHDNAILLLKQIGVGNVELIHSLKEKLRDCNNERMCGAFAECLGTIDTDNEEAVNILIDLLCNGKEISEVEDIRNYAADALIGLGNQNTRVISTLNNLLKSSNINEKTYQVLVKIIGEIGIHKQESIKFLSEPLEHRKDTNSLWETALALEKIYPGNDYAMDVLIKLIENTLDEEFRQSLMWSLVFNKNLEGKNIGSGNPKLITSILRLLNTNTNKKTRETAAKVLEKISIGNVTAIEVMTKLLENIQDVDIQKAIALSLNSIDPGNSIAVSSLVNLLKLGILKQWDKKSLISSLKETLPADQLLLFAYDLRDYLDSKTYNSIVWYCSSNMKYPDFYRACQIRLHR